MCIYCERKQGTGWNQPPLCDENWEHPTDTIKDRVSSNLNLNEDPDWEARIHDYQSSTPELVVTSKKIAEALWGSGIASIYIPIKYCPVCGRKLGKSGQDIWIPVSKRTPTKEECVGNMGIFWVTTTSGYVIEAIYLPEKDIWYNNYDGYPIKITAWQPCIKPEPYKGIVPERDKNGV